MPDKDSDFAKERESRMRKESDEVNALLRSLGFKPKAKGVRANGENDAPKRRRNAT